jgi:hypothetical protein
MSLVSLPLLLQEDPSLTPAQLTAIMLFRLNKRTRDWINLSPRIGCSTLAKLMSALATSDPTPAHSLQQLRLRPLHRVSETEFTSPSTFPVLAPALPRVHSPQ